MKREIRLRAADGVRLVWICAVLVGVSGYAFIHVPFARSISGDYRSVEQLYEQTAANERLVAQEPALRRMQHLVEADLAHVSHGGSLSSTTAAMLELLQRCALRAQVLILAVDPGAAQPESGDRRLAATQLTIRVRGEFRQILAFLEDLPHHSTLLAVNGTQLAPVSNLSVVRDSPVLDATVQATLYRLRLNGFMEKTAHASTTR